MHSEKGLGKVCMKTRLVGIVSLMVKKKMAASVTGSTLSEHDIPGATLQGCNPAVLKADELCFWLNTQTSDEIQLKAKLQKINPNFALAQIMSPGGASCKETKFGKSPSGSYASYQLQFTESHFQVYSNIDSAPRVDSDSDQNTMNVYPEFPSQQSQQYEIPAGIGSQQKELLDYLIVDEVTFNNIERNTRGQATSQVWKAD